MLVCTVVKREFKSYFATPIAYVVLMIFWFLAGVLTFYMGGFFERNQADLIPFFSMHPWLYLFLVPAVSMRLWSEERKSGTLELLLTLPIKTFEAVIGKFLAAWFFIGIALLGTLPLWLTVNYLGSPDNGVIFTSYLGSWLMAGAFLSIGCCISALTTNQVIAFVLSLLVCFLFLLSGFPVVIDTATLFLPRALVDGVAQLSFLSHFQELSRGVVDFRSVFYFILVSWLWLYATVEVIETAKES